jgi:H+/gluconate symporter-like permease
MAVLWGCFNAIPVMLIILLIVVKCSIIPVKLMSKITFEEYKSAIKTKYQSSKMEDVSGILLNPSPAQLRNLCLIHFDNSLSINDENTMKFFFQVKEGGFKKSY